MQINTQSTSTCLTECSQFNVIDFKDKWKRARISALTSVLYEGLLKSPTPFDTQFDQQDEVLLLKKVTSDHKDLALKKVFDHSRKLGQSLTKFYGMTLEISDLAELLPQLDLPCFSQPWKKHNEAQVLERVGCSSLENLGHAQGTFGCDYWREALDGLVMGVGENERLARHRSLGHGDSNCLDILFTENYVLPKVINADTQLDSLKSINPAVSQKFGPIPDEIQEKLTALQNRFKGMKVQLTLDGFSEGTLYYQLQTEEGVLCGAGGTLMHDSFNREFGKIFPSLIAKDASPLAVYGGSS